MLRVHAVSAAADEEVPTRLNANAEAVTEAAWKVPSKLLREAWPWPGLIESRERSSHCACEPRMVRNYRCGRSVWSASRIAGCAAVLHCVIRSTR